MDPFSALSVACSVVQFIDFGSKVGKHMVEMYKNDSFERHEYFEDVARDLDDFVQLLERRKTILEPTGPGSAGTDESQNDLAINLLVTQCRGLAADLHEKIQSVSERLPPQHKLSRAMWKASDIEDTMERLKVYRDQIILRLLQSLSAKADLSLGLSEDLQKNVSKVVDVLAIYQERQKESTNSVARNLAVRMDESDRLARRFHEETFAAILTLNNGKTKILEPRSHDGEPLDMEKSADHRAMQFRWSPSSNKPEASMRDLRLAERRILQSLYFRQMMDRLDSIKCAHASTYEWIFCQPEEASKPWDNFSRWLEASHGCYWVCGKAGAGKSTLMKFVCQDTRTTAALKKWAGNDYLVTGYCFFWGLGSSIQKSQEGLLRSLLHQILSKEPHLISLVMAELLPLATNLRSGELLIEPSLAELTRWLQRLLSLDLQHRFFFVLDGIDEFDGDYTDIVELLSSLSKNKQVKILVSSRPIPLCVENFSKFPKLYLHDLTAYDIRRFAEDCLQQRLQNKGSEWDVIVDEVVEKASGVFIWVELSVKSILRGLENRDNLEELKQRLSELPSDLADLYAHMLRNMTPMYRRQAAGLFRLALQALAVQGDNPLTALQMSFAEEDHFKVFDRPIQAMTVEEEFQRCDEIDGRIRSRCCGLLETRRPLGSERQVLSCLRFDYPCVDFLHRTVVEFLHDQTIWGTTIALDEEQERHVAALEPSLALYHSCAAMCKITPRPATIDAAYSSLTWHMMRNSLAYARHAQRSGHPVPRVFLRDLDNTMSVHWGHALGIPRLLALTKHPRLTMDQPRLDLQGTERLWPTTYVSIRPCNPEINLAVSSLNPMDFASLSVCYGLSAFIREELACGSLSAVKSQNGLNRHLYDATGHLLYRRYLSGAEGQAYEMDMLAICEDMLRHGADPNTPLGEQGESAWILVLQHAVSLQGQDDHRGFMVAFEENRFPRTLAKLVTSFIVAKANINARVIWRTTRSVGDGRAIVYRRSARRVLDLLFSGTPVPPSPFDALLGQTSPAAAECTLFEKFHSSLMALLEDRGAVAKEWEGNRLVFESVATRTMPDQPKLSLTTNVGRDLESTPGFAKTNSSSGSLSGTRGRVWQKIWTSIQGGKSNE